MIDEKRFKLVDTKTGKEYEFDGIKGSIGPDVINISSLYKKTGLFTYDPGFTSTASCESSITFIDGDKGKLLYRGFDIAELAVKSNFSIISFLYLLLRHEVYCLYGQF